MSSTWPCVLATECCTDAVRTPQYSPETRARTPFPLRLAGASIGESLSDFDLWVREKCSELGRCGARRVMAVADTASLRTVAVQLRSLSADEENQPIIAREEGYVLHTCALSA